MDIYTILCTEEQTKKALELGAPIEDHPMYKYDEDDSPKIVHNNEWNREIFSYCPTAEQMLGWLEEQDKINYITISNTGDDWYYDINTIDDTACLVSLYCCSRKEATLAAIDAALEYLTNSKSK